MTDYTVDADWEAKDNAATGSADKVIRGVEFQTEFDLIANAISSKFDSDTAVDIGSGSINNTTIGAATPASGTFTNLTASGTVSLPSSNVTIGSVDSTEIGYLNGVTSNIQTQFNNLNTSNWDAAYNDKINSAGFNTSTGVLTLTQQDSGTVTADLDGRFPVYKSGTFTPQFTDGSFAGTATYAEGSYVALQIGGVTVVSFVRITFVNVNTSGLTAGNDVVISSIPSDARVTLSSSQGNYDGIVSAFRGINLGSVGAQVVATYGGSAGTLKLRENDENGITALTVGDFTSGNNSISVKLQIQ